jgi:hypothetical protein
MKSPMTDAARFLDLICPAFGTELLNLAAIDAKSDKFMGDVFRADDRDGQSNFINRYRARNLYFGLNPLAQTPEKGKAKKTDVGHLCIMGADFDPRSVATRDADLKEYRALLATFPLPPSVLIDSGRGLQALWILRHAVRVNGNLQTLEAYTKALCVRLGADHTHDISRLFRLPGTVNYPSRKKQAAGWVNESPTRLIECSDRRYALDEFDFLFTESPDIAPRAKTTRKTRAAARPNGGGRVDRSRDLLREVGKARRAKKSREQIHKEQDSHPHAADQANPQRAVDSAINKIDSDEARLVEDINREHALIWSGGELRVLWMREWEHGVPRLSRVGDIKLKYLPRCNGKINPIDTWMANEGRAEYTGICFEPGVEDTGKKLNLFRGWAEEPKKGDCSLILAHLRDECCDGDDGLFGYVIEWFANLFQFPRDKPGTLLATGSEEGAGKGALARYFKCILGPHLVQLSSSEQLLGRFNPFLATALLVFGDEVVWAGDKRGADKFKSYITEEDVYVERKFVDGITIKNYARFITATNHEHLAPAGTSARRYVVLPVSERRIGDQSYWNALEAERQGDGPSALLHHLLHEVKITRNLREVPKTAALAQQKLLSLDSIGEFWRCMLQTQDHYLEEGFGNNKTTVAQWSFGDIVLTATLHKFYLDHLSKRRALHSESADRLGRGLRRYLTLPKREASVGEKQALGVALTQRSGTQVYHMPSLADARAEFEKVMGHVVEWGDVLVDADGKEFERTFDLNGDPKW